MKNPAQKIKDNLPGLLLAFKKLSEQEVLVGVPAGAGGPDGSDANYASIAYWQDNGAPEAKIPARPFMKPGIKSVQREVAVCFKQAAQKGLEGKEEVGNYLIKAGLIASSAIKNHIDEGIPPPLADSTLRARARGKPGIKISKGAKLEIEERAARVAGGMTADEARASDTLDNTTPLVITGGLRNSITFVVKES